MDSNRLDKIRLDKKRKEKRRSNKGGFSASPHRQIKKKWSLMTMKKMHEHPEMRIRNRNSHIETADAAPLPEDVRAALMNNSRLEVADDTPLASYKRAKLLKNARIEKRNKTEKKEESVTMEQYKAEVMRLLAKLEDSSTLWRTIYTLLIRA